jgi:hypothetical protein
VTRDFLLSFFSESSSPGLQKIASVTFLYNYFTFMQLLTAGVVDAGGKLSLASAANLLPVSLDTGDHKFPGI